MLSNIGLPGLAIVPVVILILFGGGRIAALMGEAGQGLSAFRRGLRPGGRDDDTSPA